MRYKNPPDSGDPSSLIQEFQNFRINIHCCRYWWLKKWKHQRLSYPFWRLYYNFNEGAFVYYQKKIYLGPDKIILIPPFTPFSTDMEISKQNKDDGLEGGWIKSQEMEDKLLMEDYVLHLFLHFNLGYPMDNVVSGIYSIEPAEEELNTIRMISQKLKTGIIDFKLSETLILYKLITSLLTKLPGSLWTLNRPDSRIQDVIQFMHRNLDKNLTNEKMALRAGMATNSFARLFKRQTAYSPINYLTKVRIENACHLLYHTHTGISKIAEDSGYSDRYYFSKVFKKEMNISPVKYRKQFYLN